MAYLEGFVIALLPSRNAAYREMAANAAFVFQKHDLQRMIVGGFTPIVETAGRR